ncbi:hypothetical protein PV721_38810 [Streptomyces sp. MB09-01]|uniref:hypothetical protein n=1 Tax=Streptomyces sp. MB09-01 TaxID=3028666 RepID=UPI0029A58551|nr:hypothetical protein [Streptomyces sp. MB09-01]MDX3540156.1 hypothetical protein [Streptomyces sp. MB09-01]
MRKKDDTDQILEKLEQAHRETLFTWMAEYRVSSRCDVRYLVAVQQKITDGDPLDSWASGERLREMSSNPSTDFDVVTAIGLYSQDVVVKFQTYVEARDRYIGDVMDCMRGIAPAYPDPLNDVLTIAKTAREELLLSMKSAARDLGFRLLMTDDGAAGAP